MVSLVFSNLAKCTVDSYGIVCGAWPDWAVFKVLVANFLTKVAQIFGNLLGYFEKMAFLRKICCGYFFVTFWAKIGLLSAMKSGHTVCSWPLRSTCWWPKRTTAAVLSSLAIDAVNQGNWSLSVKLRLECFVIAE